MLKLLESYNQNLRVECRWGESWHSRDQTFRWAKNKEQLCTHVPGTTKITLKLMSLKLYIILHTSFMVNENCLVFLPLLEFGEFLSTDYLVHQTQDLWICSIVKYLIW